MEGKVSVKYPVGEQSFERLREGGYLYVDKTRFIEKIINRGKYYFLGRPRRFGKSLFLSTLSCFFQAKRHLFKGLYADAMDWDWEPYPVLYLDINVKNYDDPAALSNLLEDTLSRWENEYGIVPEIDDFSLRFRNIIREAYLKTGKGVVILVDEYDKPLVNNIHDHDKMESFRNELAAIYTNFKSCADYIRLVLLTGVSRFGKLSVFSGLNNISDISLDSDFADVCGISEIELEENFSEGIRNLAINEDLSEEETRAELKRQYDGYHFARKGCDIYNPFSLLNVFDKKEFGNYWIDSGIPTLLAQQLKILEVDLKSVFDAKCFEEDLKTLDMDSPRPLALLYQTGYLTIRDFDRRTRIFSLRLPNEEVKVGFLNFLLPYYANFHGETSSRFSVHEFVNEFNNGDVDGFMRRMESMFSAIPYEMAMDSERNLQNALLILMMLVGLDVQTEYRTSDGRIDLFVKTDKFYYIIELKIDKSAQEALTQIEEKGYALPFATDNRKVIKIGVSFSTSRRRITEWLKA